MNETNRYQEAKRVTVIGALVNALLGFIKLIGGIVFHSHALVADGIHSFSDLLTDIMVVFASKYGSVDPDDTHHYGHQRIETVATFILSLLLILAGAGIGWDAFYELLYGVSTVPNVLALPIAFFSIVANEILFHYTRYIGNRILSGLILANAWHHRSDAAASLVVLAGLIGSVSGFVHLDAVAAIVVSCMIIKMGWDYGWNSIKELIDTAVDPAMQKTIGNVILSIPGVHKVHQLRTRLMGGHILVDVHILVSPQISVSEGHYIAQHVHRKLMHEIPLIKDVTVHVDPEDDEVVCPSLHCPSREHLDNHLLNQLRQQFPQITFFTLHYLDGNLVLDVIVDSSFKDWNDLKKSLQKMFTQQSELLEIRIFNLVETLRK